MVRAGVRRSIGAALMAAVLTGPLGAAAAEEAAGPKEVGIKGTVARGDAEGSHVIKVSFGKKVISYEVAPDSPNAGVLATLVGKKVEAKGVMSKGARGENVFRVSAVNEAP